MYCGSFWGEHLTENTGSHGSLRDGDEGGVDGERLDFLAALAGEGAFAADLLGAAAVGLVLAAEAGKREAVEVVDGGVRNRTQMPALPEPAGAELAVLGGGEAEGRVETAVPVKLGAGEGEVIGGGEGGEGSFVDAAGVASQIVIDAVEELLAGFGAGVLGQAVGNVAVEDIGRVGGVGGEESGEPGGTGDAIGLAEGARAEAEGDGLQWFGAAVIDNDDFELAGRQAAGAEALETVGERFRPTIRNDDGCENGH
jgi:hypothetical protein